MPQGAGQARDAAVCVCPSVCSLGGPGALEAAPRGGGQGASDRVREGVGGFTAGECVQSREGQAGQEGRAGWAGARPESASTVWGPRAGQRCLWSPRGKQQEVEGRRLRGCPTAAPPPWTLRQKGSPRAAGQTEEAAEPGAREGRWCAGGRGSSPGQPKGFRGGRHSRGQPPRASSPFADSRACLLLPSCPNTTERGPQLPGLPPSDESSAPWVHRPEECLPP